MPAQEHHSQDSYLHRGITPPDESFVATAEPLTAEGSALSPDTALLADFEPGAGGTTIIRANFRRQPFPDTSAEELV